MRKSWILVGIVAAIIMLISSNIKSTNTHEVSAGYSTIFYFGFLWFLLFIVPKIGDKK